MKRVRWEESTVDESQGGGGGRLKSWVAPKRIGEEASARTSARAAVKNGKIENRCIFDADERDAGNEKANASIIFEQRRDVDSFGDFGGTARPIVVMVIKGKQAGMAATGFLRLS